MHKTFLYNNTTRFNGKLMTQFIT